MREFLICWFAVLFTLCVAWLWIDLLRERREARRAQKHKQNTQTPSAAKSRENAEKRPQRASKRYDSTGGELPTMEYRLPFGRLIRLLPPTVRFYRGFPRLLAILADAKNRTPDTLRVLYDAVYTILCSNADGYSPKRDTIRKQIVYTAAQALLIYYSSWVTDVLKEPRFRLPAASDAPKDENEIPLHYDVLTSGERSVSAYSGLTLLEVLDLSVIDYRILRRDAYIYGLSGTKKGREYLEAAWCEEQTQPDRAALRATFPSR